MKERNSQIVLLLYYKKTTVRYNNTPIVYKKKNSDNLRFTFALITKIIIMKKEIKTIVLVCFGLSTIITSCKKSGHTMPVNDNKQSLNQDVQSRPLTPSLYSAGPYGTFLGPSDYVYSVEKRDLSTGLVTGYSAALWSDCPFLPSYCGTLASDGTNFYGVNADSDYFYYPIGAPNNSPNSAVQLTYLGTKFQPLEIEWISGHDVYAVRQSDADLYKISNMHGLSPTVSSIGNMISGIPKYLAVQQKSLFRNYNTGGLHLALADYLTSTVKVYSIALPGSTATLMYSISIPSTSSADVSAYHDGNYLYICVQDGPIGGGSLVTQNYTLYKVSYSTGSIISSSSNNSRKMGDFAVI